MSEILKAIKKLSEFKFFLPGKSEFNTLEIEKVAVELEKKIDGVTIFEPADLKKLIAKWKSGTRNFTNGEVRQLPFIIYDASISLNDLPEIFRMINFSRERNLKNLVSTYLLNYDESNKTKILQRLIMTIFKRTEKISGCSSDMLNKIYRTRNFIFSDNCMENMAQLYLKLNLNSALEITGLSSEIFKNSNFVQKSVKNFFVNPVANIDGQLKILETLDDKPDIYENIFPEVADSFIRNVAACQNFEMINRGKEKCIEVFYKNLGDPRFGKLRFKWNRVSQQSREIFLHWLAEKDLNLFFELIKQTGNYDNRWHYAEKFWRSYLPHIVNTRVFLSKEFQIKAKELKNTALTYGELETKGASSTNQAVFIFQIGKYIFSEWSGVGPVRCHQKDGKKNFLERSSVSRDYIITDHVAEWVHHSPDTYSWQNKVSLWIKINCGVDKNQSDWK